MNETPKKNNAGRSGLPAAAGDSREPPSRGSGARALQGLGIRRAREWVVQGWDRGLPFARLVQEILNR